MPYLKIRFCTDSTPVASIIRFVEHAPKEAPSHVEFEIDEGFLGARYDGVGIKPLDYNKPAWDKRYAIWLTQEQYDAVMKFARAQIGKAYDFGDIGGILADKDWHNKNKWICDELVYAACAQGDFYLLNVSVSNAYRLDPDKLHLSPYLIGHCYYSYVDGVLTHPFQLKDVA